MHNDDFYSEDGSVARINAIMKMKTCQQCNKWFRPADMPWPYTGTRIIKQYDNECECLEPVRCNLNEGYHWEGNKAMKDIK